MRTPGELEAQLNAAIYGLHQIRRIVSEGGRASFDASDDRSRALAFCWVSVGSALKHYSQMTRMPEGAAPLSDPIRFRDRLAHQRLDKLDLDLLWETSVRETPVLLRILERLADQQGEE
ncbi:MAG: HepT-like ribonuclease domain-containing protein [Acidimicrobiales bacterium]